VITAVDTNILIDILEPDPVFGQASKQALRRCLREGSIIACEVVWAEVVTAYSSKKKQVVDILGRIGIKRHLSNIYQKFDVKNRRQAVAKAKSIGIL
jgi:predicted nucleic acid-binding protein